MDASPRPTSTDHLLSPELRDEVRLASRFFNQLERLGTLVSGYPPGHPVVENSASNTRESLYEYFELNDRLTVQVDPHSLKLIGTESTVWRTDQPKDYCFAMSRDGVFLLHFLAGVDHTEIRHFIEILNALVDQSDMSTDAANLLFEANFRYVAYEVIDESLAALAGLDSDARDRDTEEERQQIEALFDHAFNNDERNASSPGAPGESGVNMAQNFQVRLDVRSERQQRLEIGSRQFLQLRDTSKEHLWELRKGFIEHNELEHREGEILSAILGARPNPKLRREAVQQIGEVMGTLLETEQPWEALAFLKLIHAWRDKFAKEVTHELKHVVRDAFTTRRTNMLLRSVAEAEQGPRRAILQMFDALALDKASSSMVQLLSWELSDETRADIVRYLRRRARFGLVFLEDALDHLTVEASEPILELLESTMPKSRQLLVSLLKRDVEDDLKARVLQILHGSWHDPPEIRDLLVPLLDHDHDAVQLEAIRSFAPAAPQHVDRLLGPSLLSRLENRPQHEVREIARLYATYGGEEAIKRLEALIRRRGMVSTSDIEVSTSIARALVNTPSPSIIDLLKDISGDWLVPKRIRKSCADVVDLLTR